MANTQINITKNGTTTLAAAGKYCDRNIDVNVSVPPVGITPTGTLNIKENGTHDVTNYANALVDVQTVKPTQFVNVLAYADSLDINARWATAGNSYNTTQPNSCIAVTLDLNKLPNPKILQKNTNEFRFRGCQHIDMTFAMSPDGVTYASKSLNMPIVKTDEYGDAIYTRGYISERYVRFNIAISAISTSSNPELASDFDPLAFGCIVTFNEPIGNGGYAG